MERWSHETLDLEPDHGWSASPGHHILVLDRGALRLEYPDSWTVEPAEASIRLFDRKPPDDDCALAVSVLRLPPLDWSALPLTGLLSRVFEEDERRLALAGPLHAASRLDRELAWGEGTYLDSSAGRPARARIGLARRPPIQALLTFDFWESDLERCDPIWAHVLDSLELAEWVADPRQGPRLS